MPKPFMLGIEVEEIALGKVMRSLNKMPGIVKLHMNLQPKANSLKERKPYTRTKNVFEKTGGDFLIDVLANAAMTKQQMATKDLRQSFINAGRSANSINSVLFSLKKQGLINNDADGGNWSLTKKIKDRLRHRKENK